MKRLFVLLRYFTLLLALVVLGFTPRTVLAHMGETRPSIEGQDRPLEPPPGERGKAVLLDPPSLRIEPKNGQFLATFRVKNEGPGALRVYRVGWPQDDQAPRFPAGVRVHSTDLETKPLAPGEVRTYTVEWVPGQTLARQGTGVISIESTSAAPGATAWDPDLRVFIEFDRRPWFLRALPDVSLLLPLFLAAFALLSFRMRRVNERAISIVGLVIGALSLAADVGLVATMNRTLGRAEGNFGLQHLERRTLAGLDWFLGLDGLNAPFLLCASVLLVVAMAATTPGPTSRVKVFAAYGVLASACKLFVLSQSLALSALAVLLVAIAALSLLWSTAQADRKLREGNAQMALGVALGAFCFAAFGHLVAGGALAQHPELAGDSAALPELARIALHPHAQATPTHVILLGLASAGLFLGVPPFHSWLERGMRPTLAPLTGFAGLLGAVILARSSFTLFPHSQVELSQILLWGGGLSLVCTLVFLLGAKELSTFSAAVGLLGTSVALVAFGSRTMQGLEAGIVMLAVRCLALPLLLLLGATLLERTGESRLAQHAGLFAAAPRLSGSYAFALLSAAGLPGGAASFAALLALLGVVGRWPTLAVIGVALWCVAAVLAARGFSIARGDAPKWWSTALRLEAQGGRPQDLRSDERVWALLLVVSLLLMLLLPRVWFGATARTLLDVFRALGAPSPTQVS